MILTEKDVFLPGKTIEDKESFQKATIEYRGLPIQIKRTITTTGQDVVEKGIWAGGLKGIDSYYLLIIGIDPDYINDFNLSVFVENKDGLKIDSQFGIEEVRIGKDVPLTQEERRIAIERIFSKINR